jgi:ankyrin repeat protein
LLIDNGADVNAKDNEGKTPVEYARGTLETPNEDVIQLLQKAGNVE